MHDVDGVNDRVEAFGDSGFLVIISTVGFYAISKLWSVNLPHKFNYELGHASRISESLE